MPILPSCLWWYHHPFIWDCLKCRDFHWTKCSSMAEKSKHLSPFAKWSTSPVAYISKQKASRLLLRNIMIGFVRWKFPVFGEKHTSLQVLICFCCVVSVCWLFVVVIVMVVVPWVWSCGMTYPVSYGISQSYVSLSRRPYAWCCGDVCPVSSGEFSCRLWPEPDSTNMADAQANHPMQVTPARSKTTGPGGGPVHHATAGNVSVMSCPSWPCYSLLDFVAYRSWHSGILLCWIWNFASRTNPCAVPCQSGETMMRIVPYSRYLSESHLWGKDFVFHKVVCVYAKGKFVSRCHCLLVPKC